MIYKFLFLFCFFLFSFFGFAQGKVDMADTMRSNGKIYVVVAIILTIFAGLIFYLIRLDRKITKIEKGSS
ncbi:MAG: CcmD family protein [Chitinophagaceae bacterium]|nr:hypothetical protein [Chitinophagaceae bacterium]